MTRTARAAFPRAIVKDRSESKTGLDKSFRKNGAGQHNWGDLSSELQFEIAAMEDEGFDFDADELASSDSSGNTESLEKKLVGLRRSSSAMSNDELESARKFRKNALKRDLDLSQIARTSSAVSASPTSAILVASDAETGVLP